MGRILLIEFTDNDKQEFEEIITFLNRYPHFEKLSLKDENILSFPGFEILPERRKIYSESQEITLTTKEFDILYILAVNQGRVVTYEQIYQNVWNEYPTGGENDTVGYHVRNLRKKLCMVSVLSIECTRDVGYCFNIETER